MNRFKVLYITPLFSQECEGTYARFHDWTHTLQRRDTRAWDFLIVPYRRYVGAPSEEVLFSSGSPATRFRGFLKNIRKASKEVDLVHIVQGDFPMSLVSLLAVKGSAPIIVGPNLLRAGFTPVYQLGAVDRPPGLGEKLLVRLGLSIYHWNRLPFNRHLPFQKSIERIFIFPGYLPYATTTGKMDPAKLVVLPSGVRADIFNPAGNRNRPPGDFVILFVGDARRPYLKGFDLFINALARLQDHDVPFVAVILGRVNEKTTTVIREYQLEDRVEMVGFVARAELADYYRGADVFVCPSRHEADCTTATEALACGTPVVGTDIPGIQKTLPFANGDANDLAERLLEVWQNLPVYRQKAHDEAPVYSIEGVLQILEMTYRDIMESE